MRLVVKVIRVTANILSPDGQRKVDQALGRLGVAAERKDLLLNVSRYDVD